MEHAKTITIRRLNPEERAKVKRKIVAVVTPWVENLVEEAFDLADKDDPKTRVSWVDPTSVQDHITGCLAMHVENEIAVQVEEILIYPDEFEYLLNANP